MRKLWLSILLGSVIWAEEQHFPQPNNKTWHEARLYCQACFKDLTTITSTNIHNIAQKLILDSWIGLRRSVNGSIPWSRWSNGDPVTYQNWYPGHPIPEVETCPLTSNSSSKNSTQPPKINNRTEQCSLVMEIINCLNMTYGELTNISKTLVTPTPQSLYTTPLPAVNKTSNNTKPCEDKAEKYIEESCVALLSFGMWKERLCNGSLPFICYDERFFGQINISAVNESGGSLAWSRGPGNISHYRVEIESGEIRIVTAPNHQLKNLTAGTKYNVQVYPVKCGRDLNPQNISFYTTPMNTSGLRVTNITTNSITLIWNHSGNCDFFLIRRADTTHKENKTNAFIDELTPGTEYNFTVSAVVNETTESVPETLSAFTMPSRVRNLTSRNVSEVSVTVSWEAPEGSHTGYYVCIHENSHCNNCSNCTDCKHSNSAITTDEYMTFFDKKAGKKYYVCVTALTNNRTMAGDTTSIKAFTRPNSVDLSLSTTGQKISATWTIDGGFEGFNVTIEGPGLKVEHDITSELNYTFKDLKAAVYYTISVTTLSEKPGLESQPSKKSNYTEPTSPPWINAKALNQSSISLTWGVPEESKGALNVQYSVICHSAYWKTTHTSLYMENVTFIDLKSGTYYTFNVSVVAGNLSSSPVSVSEQTMPKRQTWTFAILCTNETFNFGSTKSQDITLEKLQSYFAQNLAGIYWKLEMIDGK